MTKMPRRRGGTLHVIACLLVFSAITRVAVGATDAMANSPADPAPPTSAPSTQATDNPATDLMAALKAREERLILREQRIADRLQALNVAEAQVSAQLAALNESEAALRATIALAETASESDLARLTTVYENMAPKDASALFEQMPPQFAAGFLGMMDPNAAAKIMAGLTPQTAFSFSVVLAGRNAQVPDQ